MSQSLPFDAWTLLVTAAECGSVRAAADRHSIDPATAGRLLSKLEESVGRALYVKKVRPFQLTEAGRLAVERMTPVISNYQSVLDFIRKDSTELSGLIRISAAGGYATEKIVPELMNFISIYPDINFDVSIAKTPDAVRRDEVDIALVTDLPEDKDLIVKWRDHSVFIPIASPQYIAKHGKPLHPRDLAQHFGFCYSGPVRENPTYLERDGNRTAFHWRQSLSIADILAIKNAVLQGYGCAVDMPIFHCHKEISEGSLVPILNGWHVSTRDLYAVTTREKYRIKRIQMFLDWYVPRSIARGRQRDQEISEQIGLML